MATTTIRCAITAWGKEFQLTTTEAINQGEVIVAETPIVSIPDDNPKFTTYVWDLVDKILSNNDIKQHYYSQRLKTSKFMLDPVDKQLEQFFATRYKCTREVVRNIYFGVCTNNVGYTDAERVVLGHGIYPVISRSNHSCRPNARHYPGNIESKEVTLMAIRDILPGDAVTWNYADTAEFTAADYETRNFNLMNTYWFVCRCDRCQEEIPPDLAKIPNLPRYFDKWIKEHAIHEFEERLKSGQLWPGNAD